MSFKEKLAIAKGIMRSGWGEKIAIGALIGFLDIVTPQMAYEYICAHTDLFGHVSEEDWAKYREMTEGTFLSGFDTERVKLELKKQRLDLFSIITYTPGGLEWLDDQVNQLREKLGLVTK